MGNNNRTPASPDTMLSFACRAYAEAKHAMEVAEKFGIRLDIPGTPLSLVPFTECTHGIMCRMATGSVKPGLEKNFIYDIINAISLIHGYYGKCSEAGVNLMAAPFGQNALSAGVAMKDMLAMLCGMGDEDRKKLDRINLTPDADNSMFQRISVEEANTLACSMYEQQAMSNMDEIIQHFSGQNGTQTGPVPGNGVSTIVRSVSLPSETIRHIQWTTKRKNIMKAWITSDFGNGMAMGIRPCHSSGEEPLYQAALYEGSHEVCVTKPAAGILGARCVTYNGVQYVIDVSIST